MVYMKKIVKQNVIIIELPEKMSKTLSSELNDLITDNLNISYLLNFKEVVYIDSSSLGVMIKALRLLKDNGKTLTLVYVNQQILKILDVLNMLTILPIEKTIEDAMKKIK